MLRPLAAANEAKAESRRGESGEDVGRDLEVYQHYQPWEPQVVGVCLFSISLQGFFVLLDAVGVCLFSICRYRLG